MSRKGCPNKVSRKIMFVCRTCEKQWMDKPCWIMRKKYCSYRCAALGRVEELIKRSLGNKWGAGKRSLATRSNISASLKGKRSLARSESKRLTNNPNWKGGITPLNKRIRRSAEFSQWRKLVFERDDFTCQLCGQRGGELHPDHIKQFAYHPDLRFELSNGRTLCKTCHIKTPTWGNRQ